MKGLVYSPTGLMSDQDAVGNEELQFDRVLMEATPAAAPTTLAVVCGACHTSIETSYYQINGHIVCGRCRSAVESAAETPRGITPFIIAGIFGLGAGIGGAAIYYAVIAIAHLEIGIVAILIGYMVGYAVRKGARGRGGLHFQVLAVALTYASVAMAYTLAEYTQATGQDTHSVLVDYDVFVHVMAPDAGDPQRLYDPARLDFRLKPGSAANRARTRRDRGRVR